MFNTKDILVIINTANVIDMPRKGGKKRSIHTVMVKSHTHEPLDKYKAKLIGEKGTASLSFDDIINSLLDLADREQT